MKKRILSIALACVLVIAIMATAVVSVAAKVGEDGRYLTSSNPEVSTRRYFFLMPTDWQSSYTQANQDADANKKPVAGCYWWDGTDGCSAIDGGNPDAPAWPGYKIPYFAETKEGQIFYVDCPSDVPNIIFNTFVDAGTNPTEELADAARQTVNVGSEYYDEGESDIYPEGVGWDINEETSVEVGFDNMIYVVDHEIIEVNPSTNKEQVKYAGEWYYFYGDGTYGTYPTKEEAEANDAVMGVEIEGEVPTMPTVPVNPGTPDATKASSSVPAPKDDLKSSTNDNSSNNNGAIQTGTATFAAVVLVSAIAFAGVVMFTRKKKA